MIYFVRLISTLSLMLLTQAILAAENIDPQSGLIIDSGYNTVKKQCTICHSAQLISQNKASYREWLKTIRWMQKEQGMRELSQQDEELILKYLTKHYSPKQSSRRAVLSVEKWHPLKIQ